MFSIGLTCVATSELQRTFDAIFYDKCILLIQCQSNASEYTSTYCTVCSNAQIHERANGNREIGCAQLLPSPATSACASACASSRDYRRRGHSTTVMHESLCNSHVPVVFELSSSSVRVGCSAGVHSVATQCNSELLFYSAVQCSRFL